MTHRNADNSSPGAAVFEEENSAAVARHKLEDPAASDASSSSAAAASVTSSELATKTNGVHSHEQVNFMINFFGTWANLFCCSNWSADSNSGTSLNPDCELDQ